MAKFVHVNGERVQSGMRKLEETLVDDEWWQEEQKDAASRASEIRRLRTRDHQAGSPAPRQDSVLEAEPRTESPKEV